MADIVFRTMPAFNNDPFRPILFATAPPYVLTPEQVRLVQEVLHLTSADTEFADRAFQALRIILSGGIEAPVPVVTSLNPATGVSGTPNLLVRVIGLGFDNTCQVFVAGNQYSTTFVSATEVTFIFDLQGVSPKKLPVQVRNSFGIVSNSRQFEILAA